MSKFSRWLLHQRKLLLISSFGVNTSPVSPPSTEIVISAGKFQGNTSLPFTYNMLTHEMVDGTSSKQAWVLLLFIGCKTCLGYTNPY